MSFLDLADFYSIIGNVSFRMVVDFFDPFEKLSFEEIEIGDFFIYSADSVFKQVSCLLQIVIFQMSLYFIYGKPYRAKLPQYVERSYIADAVHPVAVLISLWL